MPVLDGRAVVITGAGKGLGRAYAIHAAREGARVVVNDVDAIAADSTVAQIVEFGGVATANYDSVATWSGAENIIGRCIAEFGGIDGLVNNAGVMPTAAPWLQDESAVRGTVDVNLTGAIFCGIQAMKYMVDHGGGAIVNVTSGAQMGRAVMGTYGATRAGTAALTYSWAIDAAPYDIRVNCIWPSAKTGISMQYRASEAAKARGSIPSNEPEDNGPLVTYLLSDLSRGLNGQIVMLRGSQLAIVHRPRVSEQAISRSEGWEVADIARAFEAELGPALDRSGTPD